MALKLYMDHDSGNRAVVAALRSASIDILTTTESGRHRESDEDQLAFATSQRRVIYTANSATLRGFIVNGYAQEDTTPAWFFGRTND